MMAQIRNGAARKVGERVEEVRKGSLGAAAVGDSSASCLPLAGGICFGFLRLLALGSAASSQLRHFPGLLERELFWAIWFLFLVLGKKEPALWGWRNTICEQYLSI